jgi:hypothetical protein
VKSTPGCPERVQAEESPRSQEGERDQEDAGVAAAVRRVARKVAEHEDPDADRQEHGEVDAVVGPTRVELLAQQKRDEADQRQRRGQHSGGNGEIAAATPPVARGEDPRRQMELGGTHGANVQRSARAIGTASTSDWFGQHACRGIDASREPPDRLPSSSRATAPGSFCVVSALLSGTPGAVKTLC